MKRLLSIMLLAVSLVTTVFASPLGHVTLAPMLKKVTPAIVNISVRGQLPPLNLPLQLIPKHLQSRAKLTPKFSGIGSGVVIDAAHGYILTNNHVVKDAKVIIVTLHDGRRVQGKLVGADEKSDIAVLKINAKHLTAIKIGDSSQVQVGDFVAAIGDPFGIGQTVTSGVVSGLGRSHLGIEGYENFIQTDASINPGNSGGALVDMKGELIGINTAIITPRSVGGNVGVGLAIPSNMCQAVLNQIIKYGKVEHSIIGVMVQNLSPALASSLKLPNANGALVADVNSGTPAARAGLKSKDVILSVNGRKVRDAYQVSTDIGLIRPSTLITMQVRRGKEKLTLKATTMSLKKAAEMAKHAEKSLLSGASLRNFSQLENGQLVKGVQLIQVGAFSYTYSSNLRPGDVILEAANKKVTSVQQLKDIINSNSNGLLLKVKPFGQTKTIYLVLEK